MAASFTVRVDGLAELQQAFLLADRTLGRELDQGLKRAARPVQADAQRLAVAEIPRIGPLWWRMRVGTTPGSVYVAPIQRGIRSKGNPLLKRRKFGTKLMEEAMKPALQRNADKVEDIVDDVLEKVDGEWARG